VKGVSLLVYGLGFMADYSSMVCGSWFVVCGLWFLVHGFWFIFIFNGLFFMVYG